MITNTDRARVIAEYWRDECMKSDTPISRAFAHPCALIISALDGETNPDELGITKEEYTKRIREIANRRKVLSRNGI